MTSFSSSPHISVVIATCQRPDDLQRCLRSLAQVEYSRWDILVVDQSADALTQQVVEEQAAIMPHLSYQRMMERGLSRAHNTLMQQTAGDIIAFLDDDCTVDQGWLKDIAHAFDRHPHATIVFGALVAASEDNLEQHTPSYRIDKERILRDPRTRLRPGGYGGSMYLRRSMARRIGPFDIYFGPGAYFPTDGDADYSFRALIHDCVVVETPEIGVLHHGARSYASGEVAYLYRIAYFSHGALHMKLLRCGNLFAVGLILRSIWTYIKVIRVHKVLLGQPANLAWITFYVYGLVASFRFHVDRQQVIYIYCSRRTLGTARGLKT